MYNLFLFRTCDFSHSNYVVFLKEWRNNFSLDPISLFLLITNSPESLSCSESLSFGTMSRINYLKSFKFPMNVMDGFYMSNNFEYLMTAFMRRYLLENDESLQQFTISQVVLFLHALNFTLQHFLSLLKPSSSWC